VICVGCGWGKELVLHLSIIFHKTKVNSPTSSFEFLCVAFVLES
jgi:hypothetical protein